MKIFSYWRMPVIAFVILCSLLGCSNQYNDTKLIDRPSAYPRVIDRAKKNKQFFLMHSGIDIYRVISIEVEKSKQQFTVQLNKVDSPHLASADNPASSGKKRIHMYMKDSTSYTLDEPHTIPLNKVARIELAD